MLTSVVRTPIIIASSTRVRCGVRRQATSSNMSAAEDIQPGDKVGWNWGRGHAEGEVAEVYTEHATITSKGKQISRNATEDNPAYRVERHGKGSGNPVIKKHSELHKFDDSEEVPTSEKVETESSSKK